MAKEKKTQEQSNAIKYTVCKVICKAGTLVCVAATAVATFASVATTLLPGLVSLSLGAMGVAFSSDVRMVTTLDMALVIIACMFEGAVVGILWYQAMKQVNRFFSWLFGKILKKFQKRED